MKIIEWNINHRGTGEKEMPTWIKEVVQDKKADIIVLTETSWEKEYRNLVDRQKYYVFCSNNTANGQNEVTISLKKDCFKIEYFKSFFSEVGKYPDHLEIHCLHKQTNKKLTIVGLRMHSMKDMDKKTIEEMNPQKSQEFVAALESVKHEKNVIIAGDFNNYRRGYDNKIWCLNAVQELAKSYGFNMYTPNGGSINEDRDGDYSFPEDHLFIKGQQIKILKLYDYDRSFVKNAPDVYKWGQDFRKYRGKDSNGNPMSDAIDPPFPDHAIIEADFEFE